MQDHGEGAWSQGDGRTTFIFGCTTRAAVTLPTRARPLSPRVNHPDDDIGLQLMVDNRI